jgi:gamma-glutamyltranspeptidase/glutathione hydrolase
VGPKKPVAGTQAVCASQHPIVTDTMLAVMKDGGNAVDAAIAGCLVQATVQQDMTNHTGTVSFLFWEASSEQSYYLNGTGTIVPDLPPFHRVPGGHGLYAPAGTSGPIAVIPGFMPSLKAMHERFGTKSWEYLCQPAIHWAEVGHEVDSFELYVLAATVDFYLYTESGREHFTPDGYLPSVGDRWPKPALARTLKSLAKEGPDYFITGEWAHHFVQRANELGWNIEPSHMEQIPPSWDGGTRYNHRAYEIVQPSPPQRQAVFCSIVLGILRELDVTSLGHYSQSPQALYYMAHALRRADFETGYLNDPRIWQDPTETLMSPDYHRFLADVLRTSRPRVDLSKHVELMHGPSALIAAGARPRQPEGSCELSLVDSQGNWVQMMNTLQTGGIPGEVVDGVPMVGSHVTTGLRAAMSGWFTGGGRERRSMSSTIVLKNGQPVLSLGSPGNIYCTVPQVLSNALDFDMDPYAAEDAPRMLPLTDDCKVSVEGRVPESVVLGLAERGVLIHPLPEYDFHMGSYQMSWRDADGTLHASAGPRRAGSAAAL